MAKEHKKEKKVKAVKNDSDNEEEVLRFQSPIAHPLAEKKLVKKIYKTIKKGNIFYWFESTFYINIHLPI